MTSHARSCLVEAVARASSWIFSRRDMPQRDTKVTLRSVPHYARGATLPRMTGCRLDSVFVLNTRAGKDR